MIRIVRDIFWIGQRLCFPEQNYIEYAIQPSLHCNHVTVTIYNNITTVISCSIGGAKNWFDNSIWLIIWIMLFILIHIKTKEVITDIVEEEKIKNNANLMIEAFFLVMEYFLENLENTFLTLKPLLSWSNLSALSSDFLQISTFFLLSC